MTTSRHQFSQPLHGGIAVAGAHPAAGETLLCGNGVVTPADAGEPRNAGAI